MLTGNQYDTLSLCALGLGVLWIVLIIWIAARVEDLRGDGISVAGDLEIISFNPITQLRSIGFIMAGKSSDRLLGRLLMAGRIVLGLLVICMVIAAINTLQGGVSYP
jgi:hypothetical protein